MMWHLRTMTAAIVISGCCAAWSFAQDDRRPPPPPPADADGSDLADDFVPVGGPEVEMSPERMREMLEQRVERNTRERKALDEAIGMLRKGEPTEKVREYMKRVMREGVRDRGQPFREGRRARQPEAEGADRGGPPPRVPGAGPPPGGGPRPMERLMGVLRETNPKAAERLERLRREDPEQFQKMFDEFAPKLARLAEERERLPDRWPDRVKQLLLQQRAGALAREVASLAADKQGEPKERLRTNLSEQFDIRLKFAREDLTRNKEQAERLQREIDDKSGDKGAAVERQMQEMIERAKEHYEPGEALTPGVL